MAEAEAAPEELSTIANVMPAPPLPFIPPEHHGKLVLMGSLAYAGPPEAGGRAVAPFRALAAPLVDMVRPMRYPEMLLPVEEGFHPMAAGRTMLVDGIDAEQAELIVDRLRSPGAPMGVAQLRVLGGAMARVPVEDTAFAHRRSRIMANVGVFYQRPEDGEEYEAWVAGFAAALRQGGTGAYVGLLGKDGATPIEDVHPGPTWDRLAAIKRRYDPTNLFRRNHNIVPRPMPPESEVSAGHSGSAAGEVSSWSRRAAPRGR